MDAGAGRASVALAGYTDRCFWMLTAGAQDVFQVANRCCGISPTIRRIHRLVFLPVGGIVHAGYGRFEQRNAFACILSFEVTQRATERLMPHTAAVACHVANFTDACRVFAACVDL